MSLIVIANDKSFSTGKSHPQDTVLVLNHEVSGHTHTYKDLVSSPTEFHVKPRHELWTSMDWLREVRQMCSKQFIIQQYSANLTGEFELSPLPAGSGHLSTGTGKHTR